MFRFAIPMILFVLVAGPMGCGNSALLSLADAKKESDNQSKTTGGVAVIDVDVVAKQLGRYDQITQSVQQRESSLNRQLVEIQNSYKNQVEREENASRTPTTGEEQSRIDQLKSQLNARLNEARTEAQLDLEKFRASLVNQFRDEVKPVAQRIASGKGLSLVVSKNDSVVFSFEPTIDITQEVIGQLQLMPTSTQAIEAPK